MKKDFISFNHWPTGVSYKTVFKYTSSKEVESTIKSFLFDFNFAYWTLFSSKWYSRGQIEKFKTKMAGAKNVLI